MMNENYPPPELPARPEGPAPMNPYQSPASQAAPQPSSRSKLLMILAVVSFLALLESLTMPPASPVAG